MATGSTRYAVTQQGKPRCVLNVIEGPKGDIYINLRASAVERKTGELIGATTDDPNHGVPIKEYRFTVHPSLQSKIGVNTIKHTHVLANGYEATQVQYTSAIKAGNAFTPLYFRRFSSLHDAAYDIKKRPSQFKSLGEISDQFTFVVGVFVADRRRTFIAPPLADMTVVQHRFGDFNLVIITSFLGLVAHESSDFLLIASRPGGEPNPGFQEVEALEFFNGARNSLKDMMLNLVSREPVYAPLMPIAPLAQFFKTGSIDAPEYRSWLQAAAPILDSLSTFHRFT